MTSDFVSFMEQLRKVTTIRIAAARMRMRMRKWKSPILLWEESDEWNGQPSVASSILDLCTSCYKTIDLANKLTECIMPFRQLWTNKMAC